MPDSATARALVLERPRRLVLHEIALPDVCDDDALVRVQACGLCGTDHEQYTGELAGGFQSCRDCEACVAGEYRRCERHGLADMYGFISVDRAPGLWGGYAEYQYLAPDSMVVPVPAASIQSSRRCSIRSGLEFVGAQRYPVLTRAPSPAPAGGAWAHQGSFPTSWC